MHSYRKYVSAWIVFVTLLFSGVQLRAEAPITEETQKFFKNSFKPVSEAEQQALKNSLAGSWYNSANRPITFLPNQYLVASRSSASNTIDLPSQVPAQYQFNIYAALPADDQTLRLINAQMERLETQRAQITQKKHDLLEALRKMSIEQQMKKNSEVVSIQDKERKVGDDTNKLRTISTFLQEAINEGESTLYISSLTLAYYEEPRTKAGSREITNSQQLSKKQHMTTDLLINQGRFYVITNYPDKGGKYQPLRTPPTGIDEGIAANVKRSYENYLILWQGRCKLLNENKEKFSGSNILEDCNSVLALLSNLIGEPNTYTKFSASTSDTPTKEDYDLFFQPTTQGLDALDQWPGINYWCESNQENIKNLKENGFKNTSWSLGRRNTVNLKNLSKDENLRFSQSRHTQMYFFLREDGLIGLNNVYDPQHRWVKDGDFILLNLFSGKTQIAIPIETVLSDAKFQSSNTRIYEYEGQLIKTAHPAFNRKQLKLNPGYLIQLKGSITPPTFDGSQCRSVLENINLNARREQRSKDSLFIDGQLLTAGFGSLVTLQPNADTAKLKQCNEFIYAPQLAAERNGIHLSETHARFLDLLNKKAAVRLTNIRQTNSLNRCEFDDLFEITAEGNPAPAKKTAYLDNLFSDDSEWIEYEQCLTYKHFQNKITAIGYLDFCSCYAPRKVANLKSALVKFNTRKLNSKQRNEVLKEVEDSCLSSNLAENNVAPASRSQQAVVSAPPGTSTPGKAPIEKAPQSNTAPAKAPTEKVPPEAVPAIAEAEEKPTNTTAKAFELSDYAHFKVVPIDPNAPISQDVKDLWAKGFYVHLKPDGVFGFNTDLPGPYIYLPVNRWSNTNGMFSLQLGDIIYPFRLPAKQTPSSQPLVTIDSTHKAFQMTYIQKGEGEK